MSLVIATKSAVVADRYMAKAEEPIRASTKVKTFTLSVGYPATVTVGWVGYMHTGKLLAEWVREAVAAILHDVTKPKFADFEAISDVLLTRCREYGDQNERLKDMLDATCLVVRIEIDQPVDVQRFEGGKRVALLQIDNGFVVMDMSDRPYVILGPSAAVCYASGWLDRHLITERRLEEPLLLQCLEDSAARMDYVYMGEKR